MKYFTIFLILSISACNANTAKGDSNLSAKDVPDAPGTHMNNGDTKVNGKDAPVTHVNGSNDDPEVNGKDVPDAPVTHMNSPSPPTSTSEPTTLIPPTTNKPTPSPAPTSPTSTTKPSTTTTKPTEPTTSKPSPTPPHSTSAPVTTTTTASPHHERKFDGPSFVGGIILAFGLVAIGFVAFRFYKARNENYRTL